MTNELPPNDELPEDNGQELDFQQLKFCQEYMLDYNAKAAAIRAGYSEKNAKKTGSRLLQVPAIKEMIEENQDDIRERYKVTAERVLQELALIAFSDMSDYFHPDNTPRELYEIAPEKRRALSNMRINKLVTREHMHYQLSYRTHDKVKALVMLGKMMGLNKDREPNRHEILRGMKREEEERNKGNG